MSEPTPNLGDAFTAVLLEITQHAERLAVLDEREASHYRDVAASLAELARQVSEEGDRVEQVQATVARQAAIIDSLGGLDQQVAALATGLANMAGTGDAHGEGEEQYRPVSPARWWQLCGPERGEALARLRAWVEQVYRPGYGHLAAALRPCWEQHPLCLYGLDWLMELWSALYLIPERQTRGLASQAEWQTRLLPALAEQMHIETTRCQHTQLTPKPRQPPAP